MKRIPYPSAVDLANLPTPVDTLPRVSQAVGRELMIKRDDLSGVALSGNKVRKLEFLLADALDGAVTGVVTCGGEQSNHARATAIAAARLGLGCHLLLRVADPQQPPAISGNPLLATMAGASIEWISAEQYQHRERLLAEAAEQRGYYAIAEGGSDAVGAWGYVRCAEELAAEFGDRPLTIVTACGSGGTVAGLIAGCRLLSLPYRIVGICVCDDRATFQQRISDILNQMAQRYDVDVATEPEGIEIWEDYVGLGYALSRDEELQEMLALARSEGIVTDPVYSGKAWFGLLNELKRGRSLASPIVFLHTGGIFGLFAKSEQLRSLI
ncbi:MAG: D-cysteine desulfhydrase family protein [Deltaproteobacteria bacterium]|nr:D-cysteine desulfhydrase family protein [Deltaproteobacteria bacterium]